MCKLDLKDAYFSVPLNPASRKFVRFLCSGKLYEFLCLCFRLGPAPKFFTKLLKIPVSVLRRLNILIIIYLDDMLLIDHTIEETLVARDTVIFLLQPLGFVLNLKKLVLTPTQRIEFLGLTVDSLIMTLSLPEKKVSNVQKQCRELLQKTRVDFKINKTNRLIVFNYSSSTSSTSKYQVPTTTANRSIKNTGVIS